MKRIITLILLVIFMFFCNTTLIAYAQAAEVVPKIAPFKCEYIPEDGDPIYLKIKPGFNFLENGSEMINWELALIGAVLSQEVYDMTSALTPSTVTETLEKLGYTNIKSNYYEEGKVLTSMWHPSSCFGYKRYEYKGVVKNIFAIVVRGTHGFADMLTDLDDGSNKFFAISTDNVRNDFIEFALDITGENLEDLQKKTIIFLLQGILLAEQ